jgi:hypothetical protein
MEFAMRNPVAFAAIGLALMAGTTLAHAQTAETIITPEPGGAARIVRSVPVKTIETVRIVETTGPKAGRTAARHVSSNLGTRRVTTRTIVREAVTPSPPGPAVEAVADPAYPPLYDMVTSGAAPLGAVPAAAPGAAPVQPAWQYVYEPDRTLVIDPSTGIAVQSLPR